MEEIDIVRLNEDYPQHDNNYQNLSVSVVCIDKDGLEQKGFYDENNDQWYNHNGKKIHNVVAWKSL